MISFQTRRAGLTSLTALAGLVCYIAIAHATGVAPAEPMTVAYSVAPDAPRDASVPQAAEVFAGLGGTMQADAPTF